MLLLSFDTCSWNINHRCYSAVCCFSILFCIVLLNMNQDLAFCEEAIPHASSMNIKCKMSKDEHPRCYSERKHRINTIITNFFYLLVFMQTGSYFVWSFCYENIDRVRRSVRKTYRDIRQVYGRYLLCRVVFVAVLEFSLSVAYFFCAFWIMEFDVDLFVFSTPFVRLEQMGATQIARYFALECRVDPTDYYATPASVCYFPLNKNLLFLFKFIQAINVAFIVCNAVCLALMTLELCRSKFVLEKYPEVALSRNVYILFKLTGYEPLTLQEYESTVQQLQNTLSLSSTYMSSSMIMSQSACSANVKLNDTTVECDESMYTSV